jgi:anthranilate synthase component 1
LLESVPLIKMNNVQINAAYDAAIERIKKAAADLTKPLSYVAVEPPQPDDYKSKFDPKKNGNSYQRAVLAAKEYIKAGDIFQVVLSQRFDLRLNADPFDVYRVLRQVNPSPYMYYVKHPDLTIVGSSPEPMVQLRNGKVISRPIAGTRKRGVDEEHDRKLAAELKENPKEVAEHIMLVDLARNDVGRVAKFGTMNVDELMSLERYSHVMHLTSQVSGELQAGLGPIDVLRATLPAGTVSGAPKVRAMEIIDELEPVKRGPYAGVVGYVDFCGNLDTAIAIRTMFIGEHGASLQAGAGIVADSIPEDEDLECFNKTAALMAAIPAARRMTAARKAAGEKQ